MHLKSRVIRILPLILLSGVFVPISSFGEEWWLKRDIGSDDDEPFTTQASTLWTNAFGEAASKIVSGDVCYVDHGRVYSVRKTTTYPGTTLHFGSPDGSTAGEINFRQYKLNVNDFRWHNGSMGANYGAGRSCGFNSGNIYLDNPTKTHTFNASTDGMVISLNAALHCDDTSMVLKFATSKKNVLMPLTGDNCNYKGKISYNCGSSMQMLIAAHANALGDPSMVRDDAVTFDVANATFAVKKGVTPNAARGITIKNTGFSVYAANILYSEGTEAKTYTYDCSEYELPMKISGSYGFTKAGDGTVTLSGAYAATGAIVVSAGTLIIGAEAEFPDQQAITVKAGATLEVHQPLSNFAITVEEGANVVRSMDTISVPFDPTTTNVTTVVKHRFALEPGVRQPIALSSAYLVPCHDALALEVLRIEPGSRDFTADDFEDETEKTYGLPRTTFAVTKDLDGTQHVIVTTRPVVKSKAYIENVGINGVASSWSDSAKPHDGADYLLVHGVGSLKKFDFGGDTLTIANSVMLRFRYEDASGVGKFHTRTGEPVTIYPGCYTDQNYNGKDFSATGEIFLPGQFGDSGYFNADLRYGRTASYDGSLSIDATLTGAGTLQISGVKNGTSWNGINGNNTNYFGKIIVTGNGTTVETKGTQCRVSKPEALGGRLDEFQENALTLTGYAMIKATGNVALTNDMNRGIYIGSQGGFNCDAGKTFTCGWPIKLGAGGNIYKHGAGTLELGGALTLTDAASNKLIVRAGAVSALSDEAVAGLTLTATNDFTITVSPRSTAVNGFGSVALTGDADPKITVAFDVASAEKGVNYKLPICTVESDSGLTADSFVIQKARGYVCTLVSETVDETKTRWSLDCTKAGLIMVVR